MTKNILMRLALVPVLFGALLLPVNFIDSPLFSSGTAYATWKETALTNNTSTSQSPATAYDSSPEKIHVVWADNTGGHYEIYYSSFNGTTWETSIMISEGNGADSQRPSITIDPSHNIHVVWEDSKYGNPEIFYRKYNYSGSSWDPIVRITTSTNTQGNPQIRSGSSGYLHLTYSTYISSTSYKICYRRYISSWGGEVAICSSSTNIGVPKIVVSSNRVYVFWWADGDGVNSSEIYDKMSSALRSRLSP